MAISGQGAQLRRWNGSGWKPIGEVTSLTGPNMSRSTIDSTHLGVTGGYQTFIGGLRDGGDITFTMNYNRDDYETLKEDFEAEQPRDYEMLLPDDEQTSIELQGLVTELPLSIPTNDRITADVTIKISGEVTVESGSGS